MKLTAKISVVLEDLILHSFNDNESYPDLLLLKQLLYDILLGKSYDFMFYHTHSVSYSFRNLIRQSLKLHKAMDIYTKWFIVF